MTVLTEDPVRIFKAPDDVPVLLPEVEAPALDDPIMALPVSEVGACAALMPMEKVSVEVVVV